MPERLTLLNAWLTETLGRSDARVEAASSDASFRRYWRVRFPERTFVAMDAPGAPDEIARYVRLAGAFRAIGLNTPAIRAHASDMGFVLMDDLGTRLYLDALGPDSVDRLYGEALGALAVIQARGPTEGLPAYDGPFLRREMELFREWLLDKHLGLALSAAEDAMLQRAFDVLVESALEQPSVCVHRDFHSRNLMVTAPPSPGILDFQDAVAGPVTYDLVSLLRDCYIAWPRERVEEWALGYFGLAVESGILRVCHEPTFLGWFDRMGIQRHLKASGIFARLAIRDGKPGYLKDIPRTLGYVVEIAPAYHGLEGLAELIEARVLPAVAVPS
jgi:aminoglycoside/choline kinase family phosphotransferase